MVKNKSSLYHTALLALYLELVILTSFPALAQTQLLNQKALARLKVSTEQTHSFSARRAIPPNNQLTGQKC